MTFVTARDLRLRPASVWERLKKEGDVVITVNGRPMAIMTGTTPESLEESLMLLKRLRAEAAIARLREGAARKGRAALTPAAIDKEIRAARRARG